MVIDNSVLVWLDDYAACLERMLDDQYLDPNSPKYVVAKSRRDRVMQYIALNATEEQLRAWMGGGGAIPASYTQEVSALEGAKL